MYLTAPARAVTVAANQAWQPTGITVEANVGLTIAYESGLWAADPATNGGQIYDANGCPGVIVPADQTSYPITGVAMGALIPAASVLPSGVDTTPYTTLDPVMNPQPALTANPNQALTDALAVQAPNAFIQMTVSSANGKGAVTNIGFEQQHADVTFYDFTYRLESFDGGTSYTQLQYSQTITMALPIAGSTISFPHVTANTLTKTSS